jgi:hypothetical protein
MAEERIVTPFRLRRSMRRAIDEVVALLGGPSREDVVHLLLLDGMRITYERLGIERDPAVMASELLRSLGSTWEGELGDDEIAAIATTRRALDRIAGIRVRENATAVPGNPAVRGAGH